MIYFSKNIKTLSLLVALPIVVSACNSGNSDLLTATSNSPSEISAQSENPSSTFAITGSPSTIENTPSQETPTTNSPINSTPNQPSSPVASNPPAAPNPTPSTTPTPTRPARTYSTDVLLFNGSGTWSSEVSSIQSILSTHGASYQMVNSAQLEAMSVDDIAKFGLLIFPGGSGGTQASSLSSDAHARLRAAVQERGVSYVGFCAGAFIAVAPKPAAGRDVNYGFGIVDGPELDYYYLENQGVSVAMTKYSFADGTTRDVLWYGGPVTPNKGVIAKYPDGNPAISQMWSGNGFVILSGGHPTATQAMLSSLGVSTSGGVQLEFTWSLIKAALNQQPLPTF